MRTLRQLPRQLFRQLPRQLFRPGSILSCAVAPDRLLRPLLIGTLSALVIACGGESREESAEGPPENPLLNPRAFNEEAPATFQARFETTKGTFVIEVHREWAPLGADRFYNLVKAGFYDGMRIHRVLDGFIAEWGIHGDPWVNAAWRQALMVDDPVVVSNTRGRVSFSKSGPNSRTVQVFVNTDPNPELDEEGFAPFGEIVEGMEVVDALYSGYGDGPPRGENGVYQAMAIAKGDEYFVDFPDLDTIEDAEIVQSGG